MNTAPITKRRRGRPPKLQDSIIETREQLLRAGLEVLTEKGFTGAGIEGILKRVGVPKGSFYHYFPSKEAFGAELIERYAAFFAMKLERHLGDASRTPLARLQAFVADASAGMAKYNYRRGCLIGKMGQEANVLPDSFRERLHEVFKDWQGRFARGLEEAKQAGEIAPDADCEQLAAFFWIGWEGAVLRAGLEHSQEPLEVFFRGFFEGIAE